MCSRFAFFRWDSAFAALPGFPAEQAPHWSLAPGARVLLVRSAEGARRVDDVRWGLTPAWLNDLSRTPAQARAETLSEQAMFREAFRRRRGLLPANGFYEWRGQQRKRPYWMTSSDSVLYFAALWEAYPAGDRVYLSTAVVTTQVASQRRPLILDEQAQAVWLDPHSTPERLESLLQAPAVGLRERPLATLVNDPALDAPECLTPA
ncbi:SOS response-associated peptidase [Stutzerimonas urumqiensis]|uniref:SOS response-associated peptidase n=1 Tax=Stutzerimonas urumqiensis TaxID=638269 RepID=UPI003BAA76FA